MKSAKYGAKETIISTKKLERAKQFPNAWYPEWSPNTQSFYCVSKHKSVNGIRVGAKLHRWITDSPEGFEIDHRNHDTLDNTDKNIRKATRSENMQNLEKAYRTSASGIRGVNWHKSSQRWNARIQLKGKRVHIGDFESIEEAERAVMAARAKRMPFSQEAGRMVGGKCHDL